MCYHLIRNNCSSHGGVLLTSKSRDTTSSEQLSQVIDLLRIFIDSGCTDTCRLNGRVDLLDGSVRDE